MNKNVNFEDTIFILNVRMRMIRDLLRLDTDAALFVNKTIEDIEFINSILGALTEKFLANMKFLDRETEADNLSDAEWQLNQLINELTGNSSPFSPVVFPEVQSWVDKFRKDSMNRQKIVETTCMPYKQYTPEPVVTHAELNGLLGSA